MSIISYIQDIKAEFKHVNWPTKKQAIMFTIAVLLVSGVVSYFLGFFDFLFSMGLAKLLQF